MSDLERVLKELARLTERLREVNSRKAAEDARPFEHRATATPKTPIAERRQPSS
ncbi:MAG: hypothetical protein MUP76_09160 [Acidimicrobiia bacterium]|nr:hypothetical protein [Acidimicrobiia bacterium]